MAAGYFCVWLLTTKVARARRKNSLFDYRQTIRISRFKIYLWFGRCCLGVDALKKARQAAQGATFMSIYDIWPAKFFIVDSEAF